MEMAEKVGPMFFLFFLFFFFMSSKNRLRANKGKVKI